MNFSQGHSGTKAQCESCLFSKGKTPESTKMGEIHELFVLALSLVWFAGATPDFKSFSRDEWGRENTRSGSRYSQRQMVPKATGIPSYSKLLPFLIQKQFKMATVTVVLGIFIQMTFKMVIGNQWK